MISKKLLNGVSFLLKIEFFCGYKPVILEIYAASYTESRLNRLIDHSIIFKQWSPPTFYLSILITVSLIKQIPLLVLRNNSKHANTTASIGSVIKSWSLFQHLLSFLRFLSKVIPGDLLRVINIVIHKLASHIDIIKWTNPHYFYLHRAICLPIHRIGC